jgi:DNA-binding transcriptional regulator GbsR (MarR family)
MAATKKKNMHPAAPRELKRLASVVGDFIRYWGFRRIHGQVWTQVYLSTAPLSGAELTRILGVSKALVSPALKELEFFDLIRRAAGGDEKTKRYEANPDVFSVIQKVLREREQKLLVRAAQGVEAAQKACAGSPAVNSERLEQLSEMVASANIAIEWVASMTTETGFAKWPDSAS